MLTMRLTMMIAASTLAITATGAAQAAEKAPATADAAQPAAAADDPPATGGDVIVTASRRSEKLRDVPSAITALDGDKLLKIGAQDFRSYASLVPGLSQRGGTIIIRGLYSGSQQLTNTVATYVDDVPFTASGYLSASSLFTIDPDIADIDRIEVLKGPQGTLYGANSLGGLIRIVSKHPDVHQASGFAYLEGSTVEGGDQGYAARGTINLPLATDSLALRVNGVYRRIAGFADNVATGQNDVNWGTVKGARASLRWQPSPNLTVDIDGLLQDTHNNSGSTQDNVSGTTTPLYGRYKFSSFLPSPSDIKYRMASASVDYDLGPVALITTGSFAQINTNLLVDYTSVYLPYLRIASPLYAAALPATSLLQGNASPHMKKWTGEVRLVSRRLGPIEFVAGGFYTNEHGVYNTTITALDANRAPLTGNFLTGTPLSNLLIARTLSNYEEIAGFLNGTFYLADNLDIGGGVRLAHNNQFAETGGPNANSFYIARATTQFNFSDTVATYLATVRYRPASNISLFLRAASGYRPGGPQTNSAVTPGSPLNLAGAQLFIRPDTTWNYEGGVKANFGAFSIDASVYHIDWKDIQLNTLANGTVLGANGGDAKVDGFELSMTARPAPRTTLTANVGYTYARLTAVQAAVQSYLGVVVGDRLPGTPDWTVALIGDQGFQLGNNVTANLGATVRFRADSPSSFPGAPTDPNVKVPSSTTVDLRAGVNFGKYGVQLRAENLFNEYGYLGLSTPRAYAGQPTPTAADVIRPRSFVLAFTAGF